MKKYDEDNSGTIDKRELAAILHDLGALRDRYNTETKRQLVRPGSMQALPAPSGSNFSGGQRPHDDLVTAPVAPVTAGGASSSSWSAPGNNLVGDEPTETDGKPIWQRLSDNVRNSTRSLQDMWRAWEGERSDTPRAPHSPPPPSAALHAASSPRTSPRTSPRGKRDPDPVSV